MTEEFLTNKAYTTEIPHLSDVKNYIGKEMGLSGWSTITQEQINNFGKVTDDNQWIHTDAVMAEKYSPYKKPIAHGFLILSLASKFCFETFRILDISMGLNYGLDKVRFINAAVVGSSIRGRVTLLSAEDVPGGLRYKMKLVFELKGEEKPACVAEFIAQAYADPNK
jgi:acyl dehydratase|tara:strand:+ start:12848 stop:13348 length:501 start_codon:yes stop_codon:yes gene_type:complete